MKQDIKKKLVKALRSGKYDQTTNALRDERGYCCLGVLCKILNVPAKETDYGEYEFGKGEDKSTGLLPKYVAEKTGLSKRTQNSLAARNDRGDSFEKIADHIEKRL